MRVQNMSGVTNKRAANRLATGIILILLGAGLLAGQWFSFGLYLPLVLGLIFTTAGILSRKAGLLVPGGIIGGTGLAMVVVQYNWLAPVGSVASGGVFLLIMSLGWFGITVLSRLFTDNTQVWPLFPGAGMALIGGLVLMGERGTKILELMGTYWPVIPIIIGVLILYRWWKDRKMGNEE